VLAHVKRARIDTDNPKLLWDHLFKQQFNQKTEQNVILVLDGIDEAEPEAAEQLMYILKDIASSNKLKVQIMLTSGPEYVLDGGENLTVKHFEMTRDNIKQDLRAIANWRLRTLGRLRKLSTRTKKKVVKGLSEQADSKSSYPLGLGITLLPTIR
jgi:hypothetical protein